MVEAGGDLPLGPPFQRPGDHAEQVDVAALGRPAAERARAVQVDTDKGRAEQPGLGQVARDFEGKVQFFGVSYNDTVSEGRKYQREFEVPYPLAHDSSGRTWAAYRVPYQPVTVVVDEHGRVARRFDGGIEDKELATVLEYLVRA